MSKGIEKGFLGHMTEPKALDTEAKTLAANFYHGPRTREIREALSDLTGGSDNPWRELQCAQGDISPNGSAAKISGLHSDYLEYMADLKTWLEETEILTPREKAYLKEHPIVSFGLEIAINKVPQTYAGGLGMLNGDRARQESDMGIPIINISLLYKQGYFRQEIKDCCQVEAYCDQYGNEYPMTEAVDKNGKKINLIEVSMGEGHSVFAKVWKASVGRNTLYLLDTDIPENGDEKNSDRWITGHLYQSDADTRIRQEMLLGVGGVRLLEKLGIKPSVYHLQEGHAAFVVPEAIASLTRKGVPLEKAAWYVQDRTVFTNHTVVVNEFFSRELVCYYLVPIAVDMSLPVEQLYDLGLDNEGEFSMTTLALNVSRKANGVSSIHTEVLKEQYPGRPLESITNGVHIETWLGEPVRKLLDNYLGDDWKKTKDDETIFNKIKEIPNEKIWEAHQEQKKKLINYLNQKYGCNLSADCLTACIARRFAAYKRNGLLLRDINRLSKIVGNDENPFQLIIGGKAHPNDLDGKSIISEINKKIKDERLKGRVVFVTDYDMELASRLVSGVDLWINTPRRKREASGTSGMKVGINGGLQLTERDGWADEVDWSDKGWTIGRLEDDANKMSASERDACDERDSNELYQILENEIIPMYYLSKKEWTERMKNTMEEILIRFNTRRMVRDNIVKLYTGPIQEQLRKSA